MGVSMATRLIASKVHCEWRDHMGRQHFATQQFKLGLGPCGKSVTAFDSYHDESGYRLQQMHDDGTSKIFYYPARTLVGRIEEEYV